MAETIVLSHQLNLRIKHFQWQGSGLCGFLIGPENERSTVLGVWQRKIKNVILIQEEINECLSHYPCGTGVIGLINIIPPPPPEGIDASSLYQELINLFGTDGKMKDAFGCESFLAMCLYKLGGPDGDEWSAVFFTVNKSCAKQMNVDARPAERIACNPLTRMRMRADIPIHLSTQSTSKDRWANQMMEQIRNIQNTVKAGNFALGFDGNRALLYKGGMVLGSQFKQWKMIKDIKKYMRDAAEKREEDVPKASNKGIQKPLDVTLLMSHFGSNSSTPHAPVIVHKKDDFFSTNLKVSVDILVEAREDLSIHKLFVMIMNSLVQQLHAFYKCTEKISIADQVFTPAVYHFRPPGLDTSVSVVYPAEMEEEHLETRRKEYHDVFLIPQDRPCFRKASSNTFINPTALGGYLVNPHIGLNLPGNVNNGKVALVEGYYSYHHYMQDRFNDDKWGCAYRSLQSIVSWFKYQGFTNKNIPSHREIQQALHSIGDKPEKFVGSRQWIGSFEVSFVLDHLLGVTSRFINVSSGAELATTGQQLLSHFQTQGTPIMIGGGVLAHTILGVAYDEFSGEIAFLILDPHYTGGEDLKTIQDKGWCGWKTMKFWDQTAHYNMCLPQRPFII